jgi:hypothetical protein
MDDIEEHCSLPENIEHAVLPDANPQLERPEPTRGTGTMICMAPLRRLPTWTLLSLAVGWIGLGEIVTGASACSCQSPRR